MMRQPNYRAHGTLFVIRDFCGAGSAFLLDRAASLSGPYNRVPANRLAEQFFRDFAAVVGELYQDFLVQPDVHRG
jgi:hypothetical protein